MADVKLAFRCYHPDCANDPPLQFILTVPRRGVSQGMKEVLKPCERGHLNVIELPDAWGVRDLVLGDAGVVAETNGTPVLQGRQRA